MKLSKANIMVAPAAALILAVVTGCGDSKKSPKTSDKSSEPTPPIAEQAIDAGTNAAAGIEKELEAKGWSSAVRESFLDGETIAYESKMAWVLMARPTPEESYQIVQLGFARRADVEEPVTVGEFATDAELLANSAMTKMLLATVPVKGQGLGYEIDPGTGDVKGPKSFALGAHSVEFSDNTLTASWSPSGVAPNHVLDGGGVSTPIPFYSFVLDEKVGIVVVGYVGDAAVWHDAEVFELVDGAIDAFEGNDLQEFNGQDDGLDQ